jgi:SAM-dependent methyltransferase
MGRGRILLGIAATGAGAAIGIAVARHFGLGAGRNVPGGIVMGDVPIYDTMSRILFGSFYRQIAADVARAVPAGSRALEVGCGPGHLSVQMARAHGLEVTGLDLDPAMIERARVNAARDAQRGQGQASFVVGSAAALPFEDQTFDIVVSTLSVHHWDDPSAGLAEIARVLKPDGRALIWDLRPGAPLHSNLPDLAGVIHGGPMPVVSMVPWQWPWRLSFVQRIELASEPAATA